MEGDATAPMIASVASVTLSCSLSNQRSSVGRAAPVRISMALTPSRPSLRNCQPSLPRASRSRGLADHGSGGVMSSVGSMNRATRSSISSYRGSESASFAENLLTSRCVRSLSGPSISDRPSGNGVNDDGSRGSISKPWRCSSSSRMMIGRRRLFTYDAVETLKPGQISSDTQAPPTSSRRSSTSTVRPARARYAAATRPLWPAPMMITSYGADMREMAMREARAARGPRQGMRTEDRRMLAVEARARSPRRECFQAPRAMPILTEPFSRSCGVTSFLKTTDIAPARPTTLPRRFFVSSDVFAEEMEKIFGARWLCLGRESLIAKPGHYILREVGRESILILRDTSGTVRAFYNVCRHRGSRLCEAASGALGQSIRCPYHAWTYALDGRLLGAPSSDTIDDFDATAYPLHAVSVARWEGFVFINLADRPVPFVEAYEPAIGRFTRFNMPELMVARAIEYDVRANWKLILQNYSECYHCAPIHPALARHTPPTSGENDLVAGTILGGFMTLNPG